MNKKTNIQLTRLTKLIKYLTGRVACYNVTHTHSKVTWKKECRTTN